MGTVQTQIRIVAWLHIVLGVMALLFALVIALAAGAVAGLIGGAASGHAAGGILGFLGIGGLVFVLVGLFSVPNLVVGWGLLNGAGWARIVGIVVSILTLVHPVV